MKNVKLVLQLVIFLSCFNTQAQEKVKPAKAERNYIVIERARQITRFDIRRNTRATANIVEIQTQSVTGRSAQNLLSSQCKPGQTICHFYPAIPQTSPE